jgi:O-6-methylguanine DNA methyltransferase
LTGSFRGIGGREIAGPGISAILEGVRFETVRYTAPGWGVGELVLVEGRVAHHELPRRISEQVTECHLPLVERLRRYFAGKREDFRDVGRPRAPRAAGAFCAQNPFPLFVPCHRVVGAGGIGAYGSLGVGYKRRLLELEGVAL